MSNSRILKVMAVAVIAAVAIAAGNVQLFRRPCGHLEGFWSRIGLDGRHDCVMLSVYNDFRIIDSAQKEFRRGHGSYATSLESLTNDAKIQLLPCRFQLRGDAQHWSVAVPAQGNTVPGNYLFTDDRRIYFWETRPATTNDMILCQL